MRSLSLHRESGLKYKRISERYKLGRSLPSQGEWIEMEKTSQKVLQ